MAVDRHFSLFCLRCWHIAAIEGKRLATPEAEARKEIDKLLEAAGWTLQDYGALNLGASLPRERTDDESIGEML